MWSRTEPRGEKGLQELQGERRRGERKGEGQRDREIDRDFRETQRCTETTWDISAHMLKSWNFPAGITFTGHLVQSFHLISGDTETQRRSN